MKPTYLRLKKNQKKVKKDLRECGYCGNMVVLIPNDCGWDSCPICQGV
jgi:ribosomal protein S27AE